VAVAPATHPEPPLWQAGVPHWHLAFSTPAGVFTGEPVEWHQLQVNLRLADTNDVSVTIPGLTVEAGLVTELATDLWVWLDDVLLFRGRITSAEDSIDRDGDYQVAIRATDYRGVLARRFLVSGFTLTYTNVAQAEIAWGLIADAQARSGGNLGITRGTVPAGQPRTETFAYDQNVTEAIDSIAKVSAGFDWEIDANLRFNAYSPTRGHDTVIPLDYGGTVAEFSRRSGSGSFANAVRVTGGTGTVAASRTEAGIASDPRGRWDASASESDRVVQSSVNLRADKLLADLMMQPDTYDLVLAAGAWSGLGLWLGDCGQMIVHHGRLQLDQQVRITEVGFQANEDGGYTATIGAIRCEGVPRA